MSHRSRAIGLAALAFIAVLVVAGGVAGSGLAERNSGEARSGAWQRSSPAPSATAATAQRDADVAFWQARVEDEGGLLSTLHLVDALIERARAAGDLADLDRAASALDRLGDTASPSDPGIVERRGRIAFALHDFVSARQAAEAVLASEPSNASALALLGDASLELGDITSADAAYARLGEAGEGPAVLSRLARRAWLGGEVDEAEDLVGRAIDAAVLIGSDEERAFYHYQLAEMLRWRNALTDAEAAYRDALMHQPDHVPAMGGLARVLEAQGKRAEATELLERATAQLPSIELVTALGDLYALDGRDDVAQDQWALAERIAEVGAVNGGVHDRQLVLFLADHERDPDRAVALARAELETRGDVYGHDALAWVLYHAGDYAEADAHAANALALGTPDGRFHYHAGLIAMALGRTDEAREHLALAASLDAALPPLQVPRLEAALRDLDR
jgi:Flp pilus assembly protein TadD